MNHDHTEQPVDSYINVKLANFDIKLRVSETVFKPNSTTKILANHVLAKPGSRVLDLGCGAGPLTLLAAKLGANTVVAIDNMEEACALTKSNAELNSITHQISVRCGHLFEPAQGEKFDHIIVDVSGMATAVARCSGWYPTSVMTGGEDGTDQTLQVLTSAFAFLNGSGSTMIFPVLGLANSTKLLSMAHKLFGSSLGELGSRWFPFNGALMTNIEQLQELRAKGLINFVRIRSRYLWQLRVFSVTKP